MSEETPDKNERNPFTTRGFIASAALIVALIAAVVVIAVLPGGTSEPDAAQSAAPTESATSTPATQAGTEESVCGLPGNEDTALGTAPESDWELVGTMAVPTAPKTAGPGVVDGSGFRSCFAHSPTGALYAAANIWAQGFYGDTSRLYKDLTADSAARDKLLSQIEAGSDVGAEQTPKIQVRGFQIQRYDGETAVIDLGVETDDGLLGSLPTPMKWQDGDWKLVIPETGNPGIQQLNDLSGYIPWSGV